jgi:hypothetical protein
MKTIMLVRLKPHDPKKGLLLKQYTYQSIRFQAGRGWYKVNGQVAAYLKSVHSVPGDNDTPLAFDVCTPDEARAMDEKDRKAARQVVPAEQALDVSHVGDEQPRPKSRPGPDRDDALRRQRRLPVDDRPPSFSLPRSSSASAGSCSSVRRERRLTGLLAPWRTEPRPSGPSRITCEQLHPHSFLSKPGPGNEHISGGRAKRRRKPGGQAIGR